MAGALQSAMIAGLVAVVPLVPLAAGAADQAQGITLGQQSPDQWRASKLVGLRVYGPDNKSIGKITDLLIGKDGRAQDVVVGVGGFLGIGEKDVAVPFAAVNFSTEPVTQPAATNGLADPGAGQSPPGTMAPAAGGVAPAPGLGAPADMTSDQVNAMPHSTAYPDHAVIAFNADQLKSAPAFQFAR